MQGGCAAMSPNFRRDPTIAILAIGKYCLTRVPACPRWHAPHQTSARAFPAVSFVYLSVERPFYEFYGINCRPKLGAKLLDRFCHGRRQVSPPVNNLTHRFFDGSQHFLYCNFTVGSHHGVVASS